MQRIVVAAKAGTEQPWLAEAAAQLAGQQGAVVDVVSADEVDIEMLSPMPRREAAEPARRAAETMAAQIQEAGIEATPHTLSGPVVRTVLLFAEDRDADLIVVGGPTRGAVARRLLGDSSIQLIRRARRPVLVISAPGGTA